MKHERSEAEDLWVAEAIHRAHNLAYLALLRDELARQSRAPSVAATPRVSLDGLSDVYEELNRTGSDAFHGPCHGPLIRVVGGLVTLFGLSPCKVRLKLDVDELVLEGRRRRALVLLASELVVNSLKHAFVGRVEGNLLVTLRNASSGELMVVDDGCGIGPTCSEGKGTALTNGLCNLLQGRITRCGLAPHGLYVSVCFPIILAKEEDVDDVAGSGGTAV